MGRIVEVSTAGYSLRIERGFLVLYAKEAGDVNSKVPLDDIESLVINSNATSLTANVQTSLAERGIPIVFCDFKHLPISISLPISGNYEYSRRLREQASFGRPNKYKTELWVRHPPSHHRPVYLCAWVVTKPRYSSP